ncbi:AraC family transcriptional regulator [Polaribacter batillariae]|uniref:AraC family transcriptional regulator n=1 Tax=Polaribacter batillariae TaxID=2808900 RepID=A0ABX7T0G0_9FLAO|nr:AraC family transcriptional regulator [Polaribacter batillariae]QTD38504.1 AraC family transcriptional regulator [Polaribacter batillariae]
MKLHLLDRSNTTATISVKLNSYPNFLKIWHYHPELELVTILKSKGTRFIGDSIQKFQPRDVVLIGKNLPHMWLNDANYFKENSTLKAEAISVHFKEDFLGTEFLDLPEMKSVSKLFKKAAQGIHFKSVSKKLRQDIEDLVTSSVFYKTHLFLDILYRLSIHKNYKLLSSRGYTISLQKKDAALSSQVVAYIFKNFNQEISLSSVAKIAQMNTSAFSRSFKRVHRKTFSKYVNEIRIGYACKLLQENQLNIATIAYESGFNNLSNFNRQFKNIKHVSPSTYLKKHIN